MTKSIAIGIPTYNRRNHVILNALSLRNAIIPSGSEVIIIDDCSTEYDLEFLKKHYPSSSQITRNTNNSGSADFNTRNLLSKLYDTGADIVLIIDSDFILAKNFYNVSSSLLLKTDGILSLFNTPNHPAVSEDDELIIKKTIGSAATMWTRDLAGEVLANIPEGMRWDWRFCQFLDETERRIFVVKNSLAQHIGFSTGQNSSLVSGDIGHGFYDPDIYSLHLIVESLMIQMQENNKEHHKYIEETINKTMRKKNKLINSLAKRIKQITNNFSDKKP